MRELRRYDVDVRRIPGLILPACCVSGETARDQALHACRALPEPVDRDLLIAECPVPAQLGGDTALADRADLPLDDHGMAPTYPMLLTARHGRITAGARPTLIEGLPVRPHESARAGLLLGVAEGAIARAEA